MRFRAALLVGLLALAACDEKGAPVAPAVSVKPAVSAAPEIAAGTASAPVAQAPVKAPMPPRPVPIGSSGPIQPSAPPEQQMMAIQYTLAMVSPRGGDPMVDHAYVDELAKKLAVAVRTADKGKTPANPVVLEKGDRKIRVEMGHGCTDKVPANLVAQRAGSSLRDAYRAGVLVVSCHDDKWECHQSTRDPDDVLCHAAPRR